MLYISILVVSDTGMCSVFCSVWEIIIIKQIPGLGVLTSGAGPGTLRRPSSGHLREFGVAPEVNVRFTPALQGLSLVHSAESGWIPRNVLSIPRNVRSERNWLKIHSAEWVFDSAEFGPHYPPKVFSGFLPEGFGASFGDDG